MFFVTFCHILQLGWVFWKYIKTKIKEKQAAYNISELVVKLVFKKSYQAKHQNR